jgi:hypothetical protein
VSIQHGQVKWFQALLQVYKPSLDEDASFGDYLERIGQYFFDLRPKRPEKTDMFSNLFKMFATPVGTGSGLLAGPGPSGGGRDKKCQSADDECFDEDELLD